MIFCLGAPEEPGQYDGRVVVRDIGSGRAALGRLAFEVPPAADEELVLSSPVLLVPGEATRLVRMESRPVRRGQAAVANLVDLIRSSPRTTGSLSRTSIRSPKA